MGISRPDESYDLRCLKKQYWILEFLPKLITKSLQDVEFL